MKPDHPKWSEFYRRLEGPDGCNFRERTWDCTAESDRPHARKILTAMGFTQVQIEATLHYFSSKGGVCDCEILFNVAPQPAPKRRRNP